MGRVVIVAYRPKPGQQQALEELVRRHHMRLHAEGLVTERAPVLMRGGDGTIIEVFEWLSSAAIAAAHDNAAVQQMWAEFAEAGEYVPISRVAEAHELFAEFEPVSAYVPLRADLSP